MYLEVSGANVHITVEGEGAPLVFVHGWGGSSNSLKPLASFFTPTRKTILIDLPGFGKSSSPGPSWGVAEYAGALQEVMSKLRLIRPSFFGHSFGGSLGIYLASSNNTLFDKLILCDTSYKRTLQKRSRISRLFKSLNMPESISLPLRAAAYRIFYPKSDALKFPHLESNFRRIVSTDLTPLIRQITVPTLILWGSEDHDTPLALGQELNNKIPSSRLVVFPGMTHGLPIKNPAGVYREIAQFL